MNQSYRTRVFANLGNVTVKALLHYERLQLLIPSRTPSGHRRYSAQHLERLRGILALKRVGVPLRQMRPLLDASPALLMRRLGDSRWALTQESRRLGRVDRALELVEESLRHAPMDHSGLSRLADALDLEGEIDQLKRYFNDEIWTFAKRFYESWPSNGWIDLCRSFMVAMHENPDSAQADLVQRWNELARAVWSEFPADPRLSRQLHEGFARAWRDRRNWSNTLQRRFGDYHVEKLAAFVSKASAALVVQANSPRHHG